MTVSDSGVMQVAGAVQVWKNAAKLFLKNGRVRHKALERGRSLIRFGQTRSSSLNKVSKNGGLF